MVICRIRMVAPAEKDDVVTPAGAATDYAEQGPGMRTLAMGKGG